MLSLICQNSILDPSWNCTFSDVLRGSLYSVKREILEWDIVITLSLKRRSFSCYVGCFAVGFRYFSVSHMQCSHATLPSVCASLCISSSLSFRPVILFSAKGTHSIELRQLLEFLWRWSLFLELMLTTKVQPPPGQLRKTIVNCYLANWCGRDC